MATLISQTPIALGNPFSPLELEAHHAISLIDCIAESTGAQETAPGNDIQDDDLDLSTWCVVNSSCSSDDEDGDEEPCEVEQDGDEEIYLWQTPSTAYDSQLPPLRLSSSSDGFTHISKAAIAHSTNSASATAPEHRGTWVVKVNKKRNKLQDFGDDPKQTSTSSRNISTPAPSNSATLMSLEAMNPPEKRKETPTNVADGNSDAGGEAVPLDLYMYMTERELSKSSKAAKIKNSRVATQHDRDLAKALGCLSEETDKVDKKAIRSRSNGKSKIKSSRANKSKVLPTESLVKMME
ncbi:hypothetical protein BGX26_011103 [Mortierella sp. AD094]|nr:hypothetical protein BGX26_011103 [Mortierella sp. AD094]